MSRLQYTVESGRRSVPESSWQPVLQRSIDAFYEGNIDEGAEACRILLNTIGLPDHIRELTYQNQQWYARPFREMVPGATWQPLAAHVPEGWTALDPSPVTDGERLTVVMRRARVEGGHEVGEDCQQPTDANDAFEIITVPETAEEGQRRTDLRPFCNNGAPRIAVIARAEGKPDEVRAGVLWLAGDGAMRMWELGRRPGDFRQGWSPVLAEDGPRFVAWWEPTEAFRLDEETGAFERVALRMAPHIAERFQGGSQGVPVSGGYLFIVNETVTLSDGDKLTFSRFVRIDEGFQITDISPQFFLEERGKEAATGLARQGDRLVAGFTAGGRKALLADMDLAAVMAALLPIEAPGTGR
jgi:hypothetical protein